MPALNPDRYLGQEVTSILFEWRLTGLRNLLDSTRGEIKSKFTESPLFGEGRWRISFLANSGLSEEELRTATEGEYVGLFLTCQTTTEEPANAAEADFCRYRLVRFEIQNACRTVSHEVKEEITWQPFPSENKQCGWYLYAYWYQIIC